MTTDPSFNQAPAITITPADDSTPPAETEAERLQAELDAIEKARVEKKNAREKAGAVDRLKQEIADKKALSDAEAQFGDAIATHQTTDGLVIVKRPEKLRFRQYQAVTGKLIGNNSEAANAQFVDEAHKLTLHSLVYPTKPRFDQLAEKFPGLPMLLAGKCSDLAAGRTREDAEK